MQSSFARRGVIIVSLILLYLGESAVAGDNRWTLLGLYGGEVKSFAFHPVFSNMIFATTHYGLLQSTDGGDSWHRLLDTVNTAGTIRINPRQPEVLIYYEPFKIYVSRDVGETWSQTAIQLGRFGNPITDLEFDPRDPETLYISVYGYGGGGVYKSTDTGNTWTSTSRGLNIKYSTESFLEIVESNPDIMYFLARTGLFKSTNAGQSWQKNGVLEFDENSTTLAALAANPDNPDELYSAATGDPELPLVPGEGVYRSTNGGKNWSSTNCNCFPSSISIDPNRPGTIFVAGDAVLKTSDSGTHWNRLPISSQDTFAAVGIHPQNGHVFLGASIKGVFRSSNGGLAWRNVSNGIDDLGVYHLEVDPSRPGHVFAIDGAGRTYESLDTGRRWHLVKTLQPYNVTDIRIHPRDSDLLVATARNGILVSQDAGGTWRFSDPGLPAECLLTLGPVCETLSLELDPQNKNTILVARTPDTDVRDDQIARSTDLGRTWERTRPGFQLRGIKKLVIDPHDSSTIFILGFITLYKSVNRGNSWMELRRGASNVVVDPYHPNVVYIASFTGLEKSEDGGLTWAAKDLNPFTGEYYITVSPSNPRTIIVSSRLSGLPRISLDGGENWRNFDANGLGDGSSVQGYTFVETPWSPFTFLLATDRGVYSYTAIGPRPAGASSNK